MVGLFLTDEMNHFEVLYPGKIKSWVTVSWLKMHLFGLNVSAMQFVGVSAFVLCLLSHPFLGIGRTDPAGSRVTLICRVQWQSLYVQLIEIGKRVRAEGQWLLSPAELWAELLLLLPGWTSVPWLWPSHCPARAVPAGTVLPLPLTPCSYLANF